ncbi:MAG: hypothetical protein A4E35_01813 [Methanoregula sp. PtaU1.Bin051]|nr:MAG: hypothetical protein A4E35_01813 [Methanoregula sp. PtaU1.Bin051]
MACNDVSTESVEIPLFSEMVSVSAHLMKDVYLPASLKKTGDERSGPRPGSKDPLQDKKGSGPEATIYVTKIAVRTPDEVISGILTENYRRDTILQNNEYYTVVLASSLSVGDPSTTRFINATITVDLLQNMEILAYAPKGKGIIAGIIENGGNGISISKTLDFTVASSVKISGRSDDPENRLEVPVGPERTMTVACSRTTGCTFALPVSELLEYGGMLQNSHRMFWEVYPPMLPQIIGNPGNEHMALLSFIIQVPRNTVPVLNVSIEGKVKGDLWGVVHLRGSAGLSKP